MRGSAFLPRPGRNSVHAPPPLPRPRTPAGSPPPAPFPAAAWAQTVTRTRLANGFTLLVRENPDRAGGRPLPQRAPGHALGDPRRMRGSRTSSSSWWSAAPEDGRRPRSSQAADRMGGSIDAWGDVDASEISGTALARHSAEILDLVADVALTPTLPPRHHRSGPGLHHQADPESRRQALRRRRCDTMLAAAVRRQRVRVEPAGPARERRSASRGTT